MRTIWTIVFITGVLLGVVLAYLVQAMGVATQPPSLEVKDWLTFVFTGAALLLSLGAFYFNWKKSKQDTFLSIHEKMVTSDLQEGRRLLLTKIKGPEDVDKLFQENPDQYQRVNRALAMYDVLGVYVKRGYIFKSWVMEEWGTGLAKAREPGLHFINHRRRLGIPSTWPNFDVLSREAMILFQQPRSK